ncbi:predicted protein [Chaetoceros tenuissimus]|uniref:Uncharacterized protein n=1 Tax=Chaetoceros tenuissimus TaxID=426638 RepID=A0AAD3D2P4_9STRA|nr:predicted protein [Chaetoceros tenuissimus]
MADNAQLELPIGIIITVSTLLKLWFGNADTTSNIYRKHKTMWSDRSSGFPLETSEFRKGSALYEAIKQYWNHPPSQYNVACFYGEEDENGQPITFRHRCRIVDFIEGTRFVEAGYIVKLVGEGNDSGTMSYILKDDVDKALEEYYNRRRIEAEVAQIDEDDEDQRIEAAVAQVDEDNEDQRIEAEVAQIDEDNEDQRIEATVAQVDEDNEDQRIEAEVAQIDEDDEDQRIEATVAQIEEGDEDQASTDIQEAGLADNIDKNQASPVIQEAAPSEVNEEEEEDTPGFDDNLEEDESPSKDRQLSKKRKRGKEESSDLNEDHDLESRSEGASKDHLSAARIEDRNNSSEVSDEHEQDNEPEGAQSAESDQDAFMDIFLEDIFNMEGLTSPVAQLNAEVQTPSLCRKRKADASISDEIDDIQDETMLVANDYQEPPVWFRERVCIQMNDGRSAVIRKVFENNSVEVEFDDRTIETVFENQCTFITPAIWDFALVTEGEHKGMEGQAWYAENSSQAYVWDNNTSEIGFQNRLDSETPHCSVNVLAKINLEGLRVREHIVRLAKFLKFCMARKGIKKLEF